MTQIDPLEYRVLLRSDFVSFMERAFYELNPSARLQWAPYIEVMAATLERCRRGEIRRLIINVPPRYLKSHCTSVAFVAWLLGQSPSAQVICASYGQDLADNLALDTRNVVQSAWYQSLFPGMRLMPERTAVSDFLMTVGGGRMATSVGGVLTGRGANWIVIDDPLKPEDALSEARRAAVNDWFDSTLLSRLNDKMNGCIVIVMQRLHQDDLVGHVLGQDDWTVLSFPAIAQEDEHHVIQGPLGRFEYSRQAGEALHPQRETLSMLRATSDRIGDYNFSSQYQQEPIPRGGAIVKYEWLLYDDSPPEADEVRHVLQSWDTATKTGSTNDYSVCTTWVITSDPLTREHRYHLVHVLRARLNYPDLKRAVVKQAEQFKPDAILIEDKGSGSSLIQDLQREGQ